MKKFIALSLTFVMLLIGLSGKAQIVKSQAKTSPTKVEIYYFHFTRRCMTCMAVEKNTIKAVNKLYASQVKKGYYTFRSKNLDEAVNKNLAKKLNIGGQTLLIVCGKKQIDITDKGFMNAQRPEKLQEEIKKAVDIVTKG